MPYEDSGKNLMLDALGAAVSHASLHTADPAGTGGSEVSGGSPAYAREAISWNTASAGVLDSSNQPVFDVPGGTTITHTGFWTAISAGTMHASANVTDETFGGQGTYTMTDADLDLNA